MRRQTPGIIERKSPMEPTLTHESLPQHPRDPRERRLQKGHMQTDRLPVFEIVIRNISSRGLCATCMGAPPVVGEFAEIQLPDNRTVMATVRWTNDKVFGVVFEDPINLGAMMDILQRLLDLAEQNAKWQAKSKQRTKDPRPDTTRLRII